MKAFTQRGLFLCNKFACQCFFELLFYHEYFHTERKYYAVKERRNFFFWTIFFKIFLSFHTANKGINKSWSVICTNIHTHFPLYMCFELIYCIYIDRSGSQSVCFTTGRFTRYSGRGNIINLSINTNDSTCQFLLMEPTWKLFLAASVVRDAERCQRSSSLDDVASIIFFRITGCFKVFSKLMSLSQICISVKRKRFDSKYLQTSILHFHVVYSSCSQCVKALRNKKMFFVNWHA